MKQLGKHFAWVLYGVAHVATAQTVSPEKTLLNESKAKAQATPAVIIQGANEVSKARNSAAARTVVTSEALNRYGDVNITEALSRIPGISADQGSLQLRGLGGGYTQILVDGDRPPRGFSLTGLSLSIIERVEIFRVPTAEFGTQAIAGTINIILKKIPKPPAGRTKVTAENAYRPAGNIDLQGSQTRGDLGISMGMLAQFRKSPFGAPQATDFVRYTPDGVESDSSRHFRRGESTSKSVSLTPRLQYKISDSLNITSNTFVSATASEGAVSERFTALTGQPQLAQNTDVSSDRSSQSFSTSLSFNKKLDQGKLEGKAGMSMSRSASSAGTFVTTTGRSLYRVTDTDISGQGRDISAKYSKRTLKDHQIVAGGSYVRTTSSNDTQTMETALGGPALAETASSKLQTLAFFAQDEWDLTAGSSIYLGLRWEHLAVNGVSNGQASTRFGSGVWSPIVQGLWRLDDKAGQIRLAVSRTYKAPDTIMLLTPAERNLNNSPFLPRFKGNIALKPELAWSLDAAYEYSTPDDIEFNLRSNYRVIDDLQRIEMTEVGNIYEIMYTNQGRATSFGIDIDARFPLKAIIANASNMTIGFGVSNLWSKVNSIQGPGNTLEPRTGEVSASLDYISSDMPLTAGFSFRYGTEDWQRISATERLYNKAGRKLDAYASWRFNRSSQLRLSVNNILRRDSESQRELFLPIGNHDSFTHGQSYLLTKLTYEYKF